MSGDGEMLSHDDEEANPSGGRREGGGGGCESRQTGDRRIRKFLKRHKREERDGKNKTNM